MDAETVLLSIAAVWMKWKAAHPKQREIVRRKLLKLMCIYDVLKSENDHEKRKFWVRPIFTAEMRFLQGASNNLIWEMESVDNEKFVNYFRMTPELFNQLFALMEPGLTKQTVVRDPIPAKTRLQVVLRYLASGDSMASISYAFRIGHNTVSRIVAEGCNEIWRSLKDSVFLTVNTNNWKSIADSFEKNWNFPNCIGAIDGKHVVLQVMYLMPDIVMGTNICYLSGQAITWHYLYLAPVNSGSTFYNYKGTHSLVLLACSDAHYCFTLVDIGAEGRRSDGGIFRTSNMGQRFEEASLQLPPPQSVGGNDGPILPFVLLGDEAFALSKYMMRPYPRSSALNRTKKIFNYRLSRGRRVIESAFGIMAARWRIYRRPIIASVPTAIKIVQATCCLHNYILSQEAEMPATQRFYSTLTNEERSAGSYGLVDIDNTETASYSVQATKIRAEYARFFEGEGAVPWQWEKVMRNDF